MNEEPQTPATALLEPRQPADAPHDTGAVHQVGEALREEVELFSVLITAASCAREAVGSLSFDRLATCPPAQAAATGFAVFDIVDKKAYLIAPGSLFLFQMEVGFGGSMDLTGLIVGESDGLAIVLPDDYTITPKPSPGVFKGCL